MNKKLLVIALAAAGLSANAMALTFNDGELNGGVDVGGTITVPVATNQWQWAAGDALSALTHNVVQMTNGYKTLTIPMTANTPLLVGQTKDISLGTVGAAGLTPQISFMQADGTTPAPIVWSASDQGKGEMTLQAVDAATPTTVLGSAVVSVKVAAVAAIQSTDGVTGIEATVHKKASGLSLFGPVALPDDTKVLGLANADGWVVALGGYGVGYYKPLMTAQTGSASFAAVKGTALFDNPGVYYSASYGLGVAAGDNIVVNFTSPVVATTNWKAPLNVAVTYL